MTVEASLSKCAHPPRSNRPRSSSSGPPGPCITASTETCVVVVSFMVAVPFSLSPQLDDALLGADRPADEVAPCVIGQSAEHAVEVRRGDLHGYNHMGVLKPCQGPPSRHRRSGRTPQRHPAAVKLNHVARRA